MDDLDLEQLKQELYDVSGGSVYDVDEIMREAGSDTPEGSENSLESLIKSLGVRVEEPQPMPQEQTELLKTKPILPSEQNSTQSVGKAAPVSADMMPEFDGNTDLSALFLAAEQTQALVDEQNAMADKSKDAEQQKTEEEANPFEEQDNVFAQLFAQLGEIEEDEKPAAPQMTEPVTELEEEPDLMARLFQPAEGIAEMFSESVIPKELGTKPFESVLDSATRVIEWEDEPNAQPEESEPQTEKMDADTYDEDNEEAEESEQEKSDDITQTYEEEAEPEDEEDFEDEEEEVEEESEEIEEQPKRGFFARLFGASEDDDEDFEENEDSEDDSAYDEEEVEESDEDAFDEEGDFEDEYEEDITDEPEYDGDFKDDSAYGEEESEENEESEGIEEQRKRGFFARLFGASEDDEELEEDDDFEDDSVYDEDEAEAEESEEDELEEEEDSDDEEDDQDESDGENTESDETAALTEQPEKAEPEDPDAASVFDALSEQETRRVVLQSEKEMIAEEADEPEEMDFIAEEESEDEIAEKTQASEELSKPGFLNKLMDVFGLEIVEEEIDEPEDTEETEPEEEIEPEEETELTEAAEPEEQREIEPEEESMESIKAVPSEEESEDIEEQLEENPELDRAEADFRDILQREEEIEAEEETLSVPRPRPEDTPVISEEELEEFLSDVDEEEETEKVSFEQLLRNNGIDVDAERKKPKLSLEEFPDEETTIYVDIPVRMPSDEEREDRKPQLFDAEAEQKQEELSADEPEAMEEAEQPITEPDQPEEFREASEKEPEAETEKQPESDLEWMNLPLEELYKIAPSMEVLRREGPVMAHEVLRQKEWIMARIRRYKDEQNGMMEQPEEAKEEPEQPKPQEASEPTEEADAIHAADELHALLEQDAEDDAVFPEGPTDKPETEPAGRQEIIVEVTARVRKPEQEISESEWEEPFGDQPEQDGKSSVQLEQDGKSSSQPEQQPARRKKRPAKTVEKPTVRIPKNLNQESKNCRRQAGKQARRATVIAILTLVCIYISCAADFTLLPLPMAINYVYHPDHVLIVFLVLMGISILLAYDVVLDGIQALLQLQPNLSTLVDLALVLNIVHCVTRLVSEGEEIPYVCIVMLVLFAQLRAQVSHTTILHYTYKVAGNAGEPMGLFYHDGPKPHLVKTPLKNTDAFIAQTLKQGIRHRMESIFTILSVVTAVVLAAIVCVATGDLGRLVYVLAATVTGACQIALICAMVMARSYSARRMQRSGAAADDNLGVQLLAKAETIVLTDEDLFPASSIALERLELRSNLNDATALAYAASLTSGTSLGHMLAEEVRTRYGAPLAARHVVEDETGGISGQVGGIEVLLGTDQYMAEHGIIAREIPENGLILALDGDVAAVLVIDYQVPAVLFNAMQVLTERKIHIWLHTRNHQITPGVVEEKYALKAGTVTVPELEIDRALSDPKYTAYDRLCGLLARDGLIPMSGCITSAREEARVSKLGVIIGVCAALLCMLLMAYLCYVFVPADARPVRVLIYMILCFIPIFFLGNGIGKN